MNRLEFMKELETLLSDISQSEREEAIQYYNDYLNDAGVENEQGVLDSLGTPQELARIIKEGLGDGGEKGEFTETGYKNEALGKEIKNEIARKGEIKREEAKKGNAERVNAERRNTEKGNTEKGNIEKGNIEKGNTDSGQEAGEKSWKEAGINKARQLSPGMIVVIILLCIIAFPVVSGIVAGVIGAGVGILGGIFGVVVGIAAAGVALLVSAVILLVYGIGTLFATPSAGICFVGLGILLAGLSLFFIWLTVWVCAKLIPCLVRGIVKIGVRLLRGKGANNV